MIIIILLILSLSFADELDLSFSKGVDKSLSYGFLSEKIPTSFLEYTALLNLNMKSEVYTSFSYIIFGGGVGIGYKYYFKSKSESSKFISTCAHYSILGDGLEHFYGISISPGYSIKLKSKTYTKREVFAGPLIEKEYKKTSVNVGLSFIYMGDHSYGFMPFISWENRFWYDAPALGAGGRRS